MISKILNVVKAPWFLRLLGVILVAILIWFVGPLIAIAGVAPLKGQVARFIAILLAFLVWGLLNLRAERKAKTENEALVAELGADAPAAPASAGESAKAASPSGAKEESAAVKDRLDGALAALKGARIGGDGAYLYQLPWYVIIGPPGAGKTTALVNSGLKFPLAEYGSEHAVKGVGGTRHCDWWFTDNAVLIDTAGRYTVQDSDQERDSAAWRSFLGLLKKRRPRQPLNGVVVAIAVSELLSASDDEREAHARAIRNRVDELNERLGLRLPVYVMITKTDLLSGFTEFFEDLDADARAQVWGVTFDAQTSQSLDASVSAMRTEMSALGARLNEQLYARLHHEPDGQRRAKIFSFPQQFSTALRRVEEFVATAFTENRYKRPPLLRGVYFTSGTQEGAPIDRMLGAMAQSFGLSAEASLVGRGAGKSFFLTRLLKEVIFPEAGMAGVDPKAVRRNRIIRYGAIAACALAAAGLTLAWTVSYGRNAQLTKKLATDAAAFTAAVPAAAEPGADLADVSAALDIVRDTAFSAQAEKGVRSAGFSFGLGQTGKARPQIGAAYTRALNRMFLPPVLERLAGQVRESLSSPTTAYEALRVYLMAGGQGPMDADAVGAWLANDWATIYPGGANAPLRAELAAHARTLFTGPLDPPALDAGLVEQARAVARQTPLAARAYAQLRADPDLLALPQWTVADHSGGAGAALFVRKSGKPLTEGVPGMYSREAYFQLVQPRLRDAAKLAANEAWVTGGKTDALSQADLAGLREDVARLYMADFIRVWSDYLNDIGIPRTTSPAEAQNQIRTAAGPASPIRTLLRDAAAATDLTTKDHSGALNAAASVAATRSASATRAQRAAGAVGVSGSDSAPEDMVIAHFAPLRRLVEAPEGGTSQLDQSLSSLKALGDKLAAAGGGSDRAAIENAQAEAAVVGRLAQDLPAPAGGLFRDATAGVSGSMSKESLAQIQREWNGEVAPVCAAALANRFPLSSGASADIALEDFSRLFRPDGLIDAFYKKNLARYITPAPGTWTLTPEGARMGLTEASVAMFQRARAISDAFFPNGGLGVRYAIEPDNLDPGAEKVELSIDGGALDWAHGPKRAATFSWPNTAGAGMARVSFESSATGPAAQTWSGAWAVFHMLRDAQTLSSNGQDVVTFRLSVGGHQADFRLRAGSVINPFTSKALQGFSCGGL